MLFHIDLSENTGLAVWPGKKKGVDLLSDAVICRRLMWSARVVI